LLTSKYELLASLCPLTFALHSAGREATAKLDLVHNQSTGRDESEC
jgi:hypothetical protein